MFRKALLPILCAASFSAAIPLHIGESWVWQVTNRDNLDLTYRSAVVVDSHSISLGRVWTLVVRDSLLKESDTAKILVRPSGRQTWLRQSRFLRWELEPRRADDTGVVILGNDTSSVWGEASSLEPFQRAGRIDTSGRSRVSVDSNSVDWIDPWNPNAGYPLSISPDRHSVPLPIHAWSDAHGLENAVTYPWNSRGWDWRLVSHNNQTVAPPRDALKIPAINTEIHWIMKVEKPGATPFNIDLIPAYNSDYLEQVRWRVLDPGRDTAGWKTVSIQQTRTPGVMSTHYGIPGDTTWRNAVVDTLHYRFHPERGQSFGIASDLPPLEEGWIARWEDLSKGRSGGVSNHSWSRSVWDGNSVARLEITRKDNQLASLLRMDNSCIGNCVYSGTSVVNTPGYTVQLVRIVPPGDASTLFKGRTIQASWVEISEQFPNTPIRWSTAAGRTGTLAASEFVSSPAALRGKALFLLARLPDGRLWQGTHVVP
ncbi:MAG: hypothetical protein IPN71_17055 [Fibrobacteres bacterium]|nr:hypothetical protein [Fibrobacterota bacterium]